MILKNLENVKLGGIVTVGGYLAFDDQLWF